MPINLPNGSNVEEIILPDGSNASEVIAPDGSTVWERVAIPDTTVLQYFASTVAGGDPTWSDDNDLSDMSLSGNETDETLSDGSDALGFNGSNTAGSTPVPTALDGSNINSSTIEFGLQTSTTTTGNRLTQVSNSTSGQTVGLWLNKDETFSDDQGNIYIQIDDDSDNRLTAAFSTSPNVNDGDRHNISVIINDASNNDISLIFDGSTETVATDITQSPSSFSSFDTDIGTGHGWDANGDITDRSDVDIGAIRWHDDAISSQTIGDY